MLLKKNVPIVLGLIQMLISMYWIFEMSRLYYRYHYTDVLFAFRYLDWVLFVNVLLSLLNEFLGFRVLRGNLAVARSYALMLCLILLGGLINNGIL